MPAGIESDDRDRPTARTGLRGSRRRSDFWTHQPVRDASARSSHASAGGEENAHETDHRRAAAAVALSLMLATSVLAMDCANASKNQAAGVQAVLDSNFEVAWISKGLQQRIDQGVVDPLTGAGLHGLIGFDSTTTASSTRAPGSASVPKAPRSPITPRKTAPPVEV